MNPRTFPCPHLKRSTLQEVPNCTSSLLTPTTYVELKGQGVSGTDVEVKGGKLILDNTASSKRQNLDIYIYTQHLTGIEITGGGIVNVEEGFGSAERFDCSIMGGGKLALEALEIGSLDISIMGGGSITAHVEKDINANIVGGGSIKYLGDPQVKSHILGGGAVKKM
jgi:hypothetical protein